ncbi:hypothetical protein CYFUS_000181 [Cystobacter fuscus]|uniref:Rad50/SbcC-type AAA domain-containing protein n=1 Tax=Cystobacter fuscus TaxID=43 RepID=A0A250ISP6_9BACT|nr:hypothetical protein [Cystobacter fuscus]ATB34774.1 hypothetical protein CYFUS_000181 [Cystobacter fuscus]
MKAWKLREMLVVSPVQKAARRLKFDPELTIIRGKNDTGKSSLIKTIFNTFGARPAKLSDQWKKLNVTSLIRFSIGPKEYCILRAGDLFGVFDDEARPLHRAASVGELSPYLAQLFDFKLKLPDRITGKPIVPPPAFYFLPFYIDQDAGWTATWSSFANLQQFPGAKKDLAEYHVGIFPNEYYQRKAAKAEVQQQLEEPRVKERVLRGLQADIEQRTKEMTVELDVKEFKLVIDRLLKRAESLKQREDEYRTAIVELRNRLDEVSAQRAIVERTRDELRLDYNYANAAPDEVQCPTCGAGYSNHISERFEFAKDEQQCIELLAELANKTVKLEREIATEQERLTQSTAELREVEDLLAAKKSEVTLGQLIESEGRKGFRKALEADVSIVQRQIGELEATVRGHDEEMKKFASKERRQSIVNDYRHRMEHHFAWLNVNSSDSTLLKRIDAKANETGSDLPRSILAYTMSIWGVMSKYGSSEAFAPMAIDAINQQEQDDQNLVKMLTLIRDHRPPGTQLIMGVVDTKDVEFPGTEVRMTKKYSALLASEFQSVNDELSPYLDALIASPRF